MLESDRCNLAREVSKDRMGQAIPKESASKLSHGVKGCEHDDDLHACPEQAGFWREESAGLAGAGRVRLLSQDRLEDAPDVLGQDSLAGRVGVNALIPRRLKVNRC